MYEKMIEYVREILENNGVTANEKTFSFRNRFEHTMRVFEWAKRINKNEKGDREVVEISAIFHDVGKGMKRERPHAETGAEICKQYLERVGFDRKKAELIVRSVRVHSSKTIPASELSIEERILMDADMLDETGAMAVLWESVDSMGESSSGYIDIYDRIIISLEEVKMTREFFKTEEGKKLIAERIKFLEMFVKNLEYELGINLL